MTPKPRAREKVPVLSSNGRSTLGNCEVLKFPRTPGNPLKEIVVTDPTGRIVAHLFVFCRHSRVHCDAIEENGPPIDSSRAVEVARVALEVKGGKPEAVLRAILTKAEELMVAATDRGSEDQ